MSEISVHEDYLSDKFYNDIALLKVSVNSLEKMRFLLCGRVLNQDPKSDIMTHESNYCTQLTYRHRASCLKDRRFATLQSRLFMYLINKYISLSDICLTVHH